jgi:hypothetical protein
MKKRESPKKYFLYTLSIIIILSLLAFFLFSGSKNENENEEVSSKNETSRLHSPGEESTQNYEEPNETREYDVLNISPGRPRLQNEEVISSKGVLKITNIIHYNFTSSSFSAIHKQDSLEGYDEKDSTFYAMYNPSGITSKIVSIVEDKELESDSRPLDSKTTFYLELSLVRASGQPITINSYNRLRFTLPLSTKGYNFEGKELYIKQYDPDNASKNYPEYNIKELISQNTPLNLTDLSGTYTSSQPYAFFKITIA